MPLVEQGTGNMGLGHLVDLGVGVGGFLESGVILVFQRSGRGGLGLVDLVMVVWPAALPFTLRRVGASGAGPGRLLRDPDGWLRHVRLVRCVRAGPRGGTLGPERIVAGLGRVAARDVSVAVGGSWVARPVPGRTGAGQSHF